MHPQGICKASLRTYTFSLLICKLGTWKSILVSVVNMVKGILKEVFKGLLFNYQLQLQHPWSLGYIVVSPRKLKHELLGIFHYFLT